MQTWTVAAALLHVLMIVTVMALVDVVFVSAQLHGKVTHVCATPLVYVHAKILTIAAH